MLLPAWWIQMNGGRTSANKVYTNRLNARNNGGAWTVPLPRPSRRSTCIFRMQDICPPAGHLFHPRTPALIDWLIKLRFYVPVDTKWVMSETRSSQPLRTRNHNNFHIPKTSGLADRHFIIRSLYKNLYWCDLTNQTYMSIDLPP